MATETQQRVLARRIRALGLGALLQKGGWGVCDQALISASNFATTVVLARALDPTDFGAFTLAYAAIIFANSVQAALVTQPHNVLGATRDGADYRRYTTKTTLSQACLAVVLVVVALAAAVVANRAGWGIASLLFPLVPAVAAWQLQEFVRRVFYTEGRLKAACTNDLISYGGQVVGILSLARFGQLTGGRALAIVALTSAIAAAWGFWELRGSLDFRIIMRLARTNWFGDNWQFGKWLFGVSLVTWVSSQLYPVLVGGLVSVAQAGTLRALITILGPTHILLIAMDTALTPAAARVFAAKGQAGLRGFILRVIALTAPLMLTYCVFVSIFATPILTTVYGERYGQYGWLLALLALHYLLGYLQSPVVIALQSQEASAPIFHANVWSGLVVLTLGVAAVHLLGLLGAVLGMIVNGLIVNAFLWRRYRRLTTKPMEVIA